jgi:hypothetical protein
MSDLRCPGCLLPVYDDPAHLRVPELERGPGSRMVYWCIPSSGLYRVIGRRHGRGRTGVRAYPEGLPVLERVRARKREEQATRDFLWGRTNRSAPREE